MTTGYEHYLACCEAEGVPAEAAVDTAVAAEIRYADYSEDDYLAWYEDDEAERAHYEDVRNMGRPGGM